MQRSALAVTRPMPFAAQMVLLGLVVLTLIAILPR